MSENITKKDVINILGNALGLIGTGLMSWTMYRILTRGYAHYIEKNRYWAMAEMGIGLGGIAFFIYKLIKNSK